MVCVPDRGTLLQALRGPLGRRDVKDGCAPQGQCGCCTVLVDGQPRVACVTPVARVRGRAVTTLDGLDPDVRARLVAAFDATAASQCGFCTPGILVRLAPLLERADLDDARVRTSLAAHLCRCTGFQPIVEAALVAHGDLEAPGARDPALATERASLESGTAQRCGPGVCEGRGGFSDDTAPAGVLLALGSRPEGYVVGHDELEVRGVATPRQGRNSTVAVRWPIAIPPGAFDLVLQTTFVEPAYLEPDASWCAPGAAPASPFANAGAFGAKRNSPVARDAASLAAEHGRPVLARWTREAVVLRGEKRPPLALGLRRDGSGIVRIGRTPGSKPLVALLEAVASVAPDLELEVVDVLGPPLGTSHRGAVLAEVLAARAALGAAPDGSCEVTTPNGARAGVRVHADGIDVRADAGSPRCAATTRSYAIGAVHQAFSMVRTEGIALDDDGVPVDLTIRSFGITPAREFPHVTVALAASDGPPLAVGTAVFAAALAAVWLAEGLGPRWPTRR